MIDIQNKVKEIKLSFRLMMDGATAQSMREKGLDYHLNWGATLPRLHQMADEIKADISKTDATTDSLYDLAIVLWKENVRECKILATMLMPAERMLPEVVDIWMEQTETVEIAEQASFNLYQHLPFAADKAYEWLASPHDLPQICGYHVLSRLFRQGQAPNERGINEFIDQVLSALQSPNMVLRKAAFQSVMYFSELGLMYERVAQNALKRIGYTL